MKRVAILGSTGSIGRSALAVVDAHADRLQVTALAAGENAALLAEQVEKYRPAIVGVATDAAREELERRLGAGRRPLLVAVGPAGVHSDGEQTFALLGAVAARHGLRRRTQAGEQVDVEVAEQRYGRRPLDLLDEWGWLAPDVTLAHLCGIAVGEIEAVAAAGVSVTHAPGCDVPMG